MFFFKRTNNCYSIIQRNNYRLFYCDSYNKKLKRPFHNSPPMYKKMYLENENIHAYKIMEQNGYAIFLNNFSENTSYQNKTIENFSSKNWSKETPQNLFRALSNLGSYCTVNNIPVSDKSLDEFIDNLTDKIKHATNEELTEMFFAVANIPETESIRTRNFIELWAALDDACLNRVHTMSYDEMLYFVSLFYLLNVTRYSDFSYKCFLKLASKAKKLTKSQIVQTMFFIGVKRFAPDCMHNLELAIDDMFHDFTIDELAIISMGFFKSKTPIRNMLLIDKITAKIIENAKNVHEVSLAALLKIIRYSKKISMDDKIYQLLDCLQHQVPRLSIMCNVHIALLGTATLTLHETCLDAVGQKTVNKISNARLKDLERLVLTYGTFNYIPKTKECFVTKVIQELNNPERKDEIVQHGVPFACCVAYLGLLGVYNEGLFNKVLDPEFLMNSYGKHHLKYGREILTINNIAQIFCNQSSMKLLDKKVVVMLAKKFTDYVPDENYKKQYNKAEKMFLEIKLLLQEDRGGKEYVTGFHLVPHHQRGDIIICNDHEGSPVPVQNSFSETQFGLLCTPPNDNKWIVLIPVGRNALLYNNKGPTGHFFSKVKELQTLGFYALIVSWSDYMKCENKNAKLLYLNSLIEQALNKKDCKYFIFKYTSLVLVKLQLRFYSAERRRSIRAPCHEKYFTIKRTIPCSVAAQRQTQLILGEYFATG